MAHSQTMRKVSPAIPTHDATGASGESDWLMPIRPQAKPPYGHVPITFSRSVQTPATSAGTPMSRTQPAHRSVHRYASAMRTAPAPVKTLCRPASATHGTQRSGLSPRKWVIQSMCG